MKNKEDSMTESMIQQIENGDLEITISNEYCAHGAERPFPCETAEGCSFCSYGRDCQNNPVRRTA